MAILQGSPLARALKRGTPLSLAKIGSWKRCKKIGGKLLLITNRMSYMSFRLVLKLVTLNDLERRNRIIIIIIINEFHRDASLKQNFRAAVSLHCVISSYLVNLCSNSYNHLLTHWTYWSKVSFYTYIGEVSECVTKFTHSRVDTKLPVYRFTLQLLTFNLSSKFHFTQCFDAVVVQYRRVVYCIL